METGASEGKIVKSKFSNSFDSANSLMLYIFSLLVTFVSYVLTYLLQPYILPDSLFFISIIIIAWFAGVGPGILSAFLSTLFIAFVLQPQNSITVNHYFFPNLLGFLVTSLLISTWSNKHKGTAKSKEKLNNEFKEDAGLNNPKQIFPLKIKKEMKDGSVSQLTDERLQAAIDAAGIALWDWDLNSGQIIWFGHYDKFFKNVSWKYYDTIDKFMNQVHPDDVDELNLNIQKIREEHTEYVHEFRLFWPDGSMRWINGRGKFIYNNNGDAVRMQGAILDITQRKQAEELLKESEEIHRLTLSNILDAVFITNDNGDFIYVCSNVKHIFGFEYEEVIAKKNIFSLIGDILSFPENLKEMKEVHNIEHSIKDKFGKEHFLLVNLKSVSIKDGTILISMHDITERRKVLEELNKSQKQLSLIYNNTKEYIILIRIDGNNDYVIESCNEAFIKANKRAGVKISLEQISGMNVRYFLKEVIKVEEEKINSVFDKYQRAIQSGNILKYVEETDIDGNIIYHETTLIPIGDSRQECTHLLYVSRDISDQKRIVEKLIEVNNSYEALVNSIDGIVWQSDTENFNFSFVSKQAQRLLGYPIESWLSEPDFWKNHLHPDDRDRAVNYCLRCIGEKRSHSFEYRMIAADGKEVWLRDIVTVLVANDKPIGVRGIMVDITERKQIDEALERTEKLFRAIVEDQEEMIVRWKPDGTRTFVNKAYCQTFGQTYDEVIGTNFWDLVAEPYREFEQKRIHNLSLDSPFSTGIHESILPNGKVQWQEWRDHGFFDDQGNLVELQSVGRDITERKRIEKLKQTFSKKLIETQENEKRQISLELHDEIGQNLTAIKFTLQSIEKISKKIPDFPDIQKAITQLDYTIEQIKNLSLSLRPSILDHLGLHATVKWFLEKVTQTLKITFNFNSNIESMRFLQEIEICCFRVIQSAVINSLKHSAAALIVVDLWFDNKNVHVRIFDDGKGFNVNEAFNKAEKGGSMGLLNMRERAALLNGKLFINSGKAKGTEILLTLPVEK